MFKILIMGLFAVSSLQAIEDVGIMDLKEVTYILIKKVKKLSSVEKNNNNKNNKNNTELLKMIDDEKKKAEEQRKRIKQLEKVNSDNDLSNYTVLYKLQKFFYLEINIEKKN